MTRVVVADTNVVASGLMTANVSAPTARILDAMLDGAFPFAVSEALLAEYRDVLNRPALRQRHGLTHDEVEALLTALAKNVIVLATISGPSSPDPGDQHLWDLLASHEGLCLVTGDKLLLEASNAPAPVLTPTQFVQLTFAQ